MDADADLKDAICPGILDFDQPRQCSLTLSNMNVYCCLACGRFLQGRAINTPVHAHSLSVGHPLFINLTDGRVWMMPLNVEHTRDVELVGAIRKDLFPDPSFIRKHLRERHGALLRDANGKEYKQGYIAINLSPKYAPTASALVILSHISPLRDILLQSKSDAPFEQFVQSMWNPCRLRALLSPPNVLLKTVPNVPAYLMNFFNEPQYEAMCKPLFQGHLYQIQNDKKRPLPFYMLMVEIPPLPLFQESHAKAVVPQYSLQQLLQDHYIDGNKTVFVDKIPTHYQMHVLPPLLVLSFKGRLINEGVINNTLITYQETINLEYYSYTLKACVSLREGQLVTYVLDEEDGLWWAWEGPAIKLIPSIEVVRMSDCILHVWQRRPQQ